MASEIKFESDVHKSDLLARLMLEGGILPSVKKHYLQKGILFHCGFWSGLMKNCYKAKEAREHHTPRRLRNIWQELFHKNRKRDPSRGLLSLVVIRPQDHFITTGCSSSQSC